MTAELLFPLQVVADFQLAPQTEFSVFFGRETILDYRLCLGYFEVSTQADRRILLNIATTSRSSNCAFSALVTLGLGVPRPHVQAQDLHSSLPCRGADRSSEPELMCGHGPKVTYRGGLP
jgi:hypothetical protein